MYNKALKMNNSSRGGIHMKTLLVGINSQDMSFTMQKKKVKVT